MVARCEVQQGDYKQTGPFKGLLNRHKFIMLYVKQHIAIGKINFFQVNALPVHCKDRFKRFAHSAGPGTRDA